MPSNQPRELPPAANSVGFARLLVAAVGCGLLGLACAILAIDHFISLAMLSGALAAAIWAGIILPNDCPELRRALQETPEVITFPKVALKLRGAIDTIAGMVFGGIVGIIGLRVAVHVPSSTWVKLAAVALCCVAVGIAIGSVVDRLDAARRNWLDTFVSAGIACVSFGLGAFARTFSDTGNLLARKMTDDIRIPAFVWIIAVWLMVGGTSFLIGRMVAFLAMREARIRSERKTPSP